jgi:hypothetical protein
MRRLRGITVRVFLPPTPEVGLSTTKQKPIVRKGQKVITRKQIEDEVMSLTSSDNTMSADDLLAELMA